MTNWGAAVPIIVAIIGISGFILPALSSVLINQTYDKPNLNIEIRPTKLDPHSGETIIILTNIGMMPAGNLSLILTVQQNPHAIINSITNVFSTVNVTLASPGSRHSLLEIHHPVNINQQLLELHVKKFVNGDGSLIALEVDGRNTIYTDYTAYATYDQGSKKTMGGESSFSPFGYYSFLVNYFYFYIVYLPILAFWIAELIVLVYFSKSVFRRGKRRFISNLKREIMDARRRLKDNILIDHIISDTRWQKKPKDVDDYFLFYRLIRDKRSIINDIHDYLYIDDFYAKLRGRNLHIMSMTLHYPINDIALQKLNKECLGLAEQALEKIDWSKYK